MKIKEFRLLVKGLKEKTPKEVSKILNEWYLKNKNSCNEEIEKLLNYYVIKNLKKQFKQGDSLPGALEKKLIDEDPILSSLRGKWARKRGINFEKTIVRLFNSYFEKQGLMCYANINYVSTFLYQPYDICIFVKERPPILLECKASGISCIKGIARIDSNERRYLRANANKEKINRSIVLLNTPYYYVYGDFKNNKFYIVRSKNILDNLPSLYTKKVELKEENYLHLDLDFQLWDNNIINLMDKLI